MKIPQDRSVALSQSIGRIMYPLGFAALLIVFWQVIVNLFNVPVYLFPSPFQTLRSIIVDHRYFLQHASITFIEALTGFILATVIGFLLATIFTLFNPFERALLPYAIASQAVPIVAVAPLFVLWFGSGLLSKVAMAALICFFPMVINSTKGLRAVGGDLLAFMHVYGATKSQTYWKLRVPASIPYVISGMKISAALAMIGAIVAEYAGADRGLGYVIMQATYRIDTVVLLAGIIYSAIGGWLLFGLVVIAEYFLSRKYCRAAVL